MLVPLTHFLLQIHCSNNKVRIQFPYAFSSFALHESFDIKIVQLFGSSFSFVKPDLRFYVYNFMHTHNHIHTHSSFIYVCASKKMQMQCGRFWGFWSFAEIQAIDQCIIVVSKSDKSFCFSFVGEFVHLHAAIQWSQHFRKICRALRDF